MIEKKTLKVEITPLSGNKHRALFASVNSRWMRQFFCHFLQMLSTAATIEVSVVYLQCSVPCHVNLLAPTIFENICFPFFLRKLTSISRQNWSCEEIPSSQNSYKAASFSAVVVNIHKHRFERMKVSYSKSLRNKITLFSLFTHHGVFSYLQNHQL